MEWFYFTLLRPFSKGLIQALADFAKRENKLPSWSYHALTHVVPWTAVELLLMRQGKTGWELFLTQREANDPEWPSMWHFPGTLVRPNDTLESAYMRLAVTELGLESLPGKPELISMLIMKNPPRGNGTNTFHRVIVDESFENVHGTFFPLSHLPETMIGFQKEQLARIAHTLKTSS